MSFFRILRKLLRYGPGWFLRRSWQEITVPTTPLGAFLNVIAVAVDKALSWPADAVAGIAHPPSAQERQTLYAFYDLRVQPLTYDILWFLVEADLERRRRNLQSVHVVVVPRPADGTSVESPQYDELIDEPRRQKRIRTIIVPAVATLPAARGCDVLPTRRAAQALVRNACHVFPHTYRARFPLTTSPRSVLKAALPPEETGILRPPAEAMRVVGKWLGARTAGRLPVSISFRDYDYMPARNSDDAAWIAFANGLDHDRFVPIIVRDDDEPDAPPVRDDLAGLEVFPRELQDAATRAALYAQCYLNLSVNSGPAGLCWLNHTTRYLTFKMLTEDVPQTEPEAFLKRGFAIGQSLPFATPFQKWVWEDDREDVIRREFTAMCARIDAAPQSVPQPAPQSAPKAAGGPGNDG